MTPPPPEGGQARLLPPYEVAHGHPPFAKELEERPPPPGTAWAAALAALTLEGRRPALSDRACPPGLRAIPFPTACGSPTTQSLVTGP